MGFKMKYEIKADYIRKGTRRSGKKITPKFGVAHDTGNAGSTAKNNRDYYNNTYNIDSSKTASAHTFIDDKNIIECIPLTTGTPEQAYHVRYGVTEDNRIFGDDANDIGVGVELCFGGKINFEEAYKRYVWYMAYVSYKFNFPPSFWIGHEKLDPKRKSDPSNALKRYGKTYEQLLDDIVKEYHECLGQGNPQSSAPSAPVTPTHKGVVYVNVDSLNLREAPTTSSRIIRQLKKGEGYKFYGIVNGWYNLGGSQWAYGNNGVYLKEDTPVASKPKVDSTSVRPFVRTYKLTSPMMSDKKLGTTDIAAIQRAVGAVPDGIFGQETRNKVKQYQSRHGLTVDGIVGKQTWNKMF